MSPRPLTVTSTDRWVGRLATAVTVLALLAIVALVATACRHPAPLEAPTGVVKHTRVEPAGDGGHRVVATIEDPDGGTWNVRLPLDTPCRVTDPYPACAG